MFPAQKKIYSFMSILLYEVCTFIVHETLPKKRWVYGLLDLSKGHRLCDVVIYLSSSRSSLRKLHESLFIRSILIIES